MNSPYPAAAILLDVLPPQHEPYSSQYKKDNAQEGNCPVFRLNETSPSKKSLRGQFEDYATDQFFREDTVTPSIYVHPFLSLATNGYDCWRPCGQEYRSNNVCAFQISVEYKSFNTWQFEIETFFHGICGYMVLSIHGRFRLGI